MTEWIVTSSALMLMILGLRTLLKGKIAPRLQYSLWALVLLRLLVPFSVLESGWSVGNLPAQMLRQPQVQQITQQVQDCEAAYDRLSQQYAQTGAEVSREQLVEEVRQDLYDKTYAQYAGTSQAAPDADQKTQWQVELVTWTAVLTGLLPLVWGLGMIFVGGCLMGCNLHFGWKLRRQREALAFSEMPLPVYSTNQVATPCLVGFWKPVVYLTEEVRTDKQVQDYALTHELCHYRQGDHIWSALRALCLVVHWYNPLVWVAAVVSKKDAELACDEATIRFLGENHRVAYGKTLIGMTCMKRDPRDLLLTATTMVGSKKTLTERIRLIAAKPKTTLITLTVCVLAASLAAGCTFTGPAAAKVPAELEAYYRSYLEAAKTDWSAAAQQYCHFENPAYQAYLLENPELESISDYDILQWDKVHEDLWAVKIKTRNPENGKWRTSTNFVGMRDGQYRVMNSIRQVPETLLRGVDLEPYVPYDEIHLEHLSDRVPEPTVTLPLEPVQFDGIPQEAVDCYTLFAETAKTDWYRATTEYCFSLVPDTKEVLQEMEFRFLDYKMLDWIKLREELWAVQVWVRTTQGGHEDEVIFHYVGLVDGEYRVMLNSDQMPEYLQRYVDFRPYESENEGSLVDSYYPTHTDPEMHSVGPMGDDVIIAYEGMFNLWDRSMPVWYNYALKSAYTNRQNIDLYKLFCNHPGEEITQEDRAYLSRIGVQTEGLRKYSRQMMDSVLETYFDISLRDCVGVGLDRMICNREGDCYYLHPGNEGVGSMSAYYGEVTENGLFVICYRTASLEEGVMAHMVLFMYHNGEKYQILSNFPNPNPGEPYSIPGMDAVYGNAPG